MPVFRFHKLVRNKIIQHQITSGANPTYRTLSKSEHQEALVAKIIEEAKEITSANSDAVASEIADVQQAIDDLTALHELTIDDIHAAKQRKNADRYPELS